MKIAFPHLLHELLTYKPTGYEKRRIQRIYRLCIVHSHLAWADAIINKYPSAFGPEMSDAIVAFGWALMALKQKKS